MSTDLSVLYPEAIRSERRIRVSKRHTLYVAESGNPDGLPVIVLHGGPGGGSSPRLHRFFDPTLYRVIVFDQRGSGQSRPHASLKENTTWDLVSDIEKIRIDCGISSWLVFGGSWGSTLALAYAITFPKRVTGLIVRGIFLGTKREIDWLYRDGASRIFPDYWEDFAGFIPKKERGDLLAAYHRRLNARDKTLRMDAAISWARWENRVSTLLPLQEETLTDPHIALPIARIETHYFMHDCFFPDRDTFLLKKKNIAKIADIRGVIVRGRYDMVCPIEAAWALHKAWPSSELYISTDAGHAAKECTNTHHLVEAADGFPQLFP